MDKTFRALADPTRRRILEMLRDGDLAAGEIAAAFPMAWASVSHHLQVLKGADLVLAERDGQFIRYSLNSTTMQDLLQHVMDLAPARRRKGERRA